jgi:transposase
MGATALDALPDNIGALSASLTAALARPKHEALWGARVEAEPATAKASDDAALIAHHR